MADSNGGKNILDLPVEIRMAIYDYLLTEEKPVEIDVIHSRKKCDELIRHGRQNKRDWKHRFKKWNKAKNEFVTIPPINTAILFVNKQIHAEAVQSLYGSNCFSFSGTTGLKQAVELLGDHAQYLRYINIDEGGYARTTIRSALKALTVAKCLKRIELGNRDIMGGRCQPDAIATHFKTFLQKLRSSYEQRNLSSSVLDVVKITSEDTTGRRCRYRRCSSCARYFQANFTNAIQDGCQCGSAAIKARCAGPEAAIRSAIAKSLKMEE